MSKDREIAILEPEPWRVLSKTSTLTAEDKPGWFVANLVLSPDESRFTILTPSGLGLELRDTVTGALIYPLPEQAGTVWSPDGQPYLSVKTAKDE